LTCNETDEYDWTDLSTVLQSDCMPQLNTTQHYVILTCTVLD